MPYSGACVMPDTPLVSVVMAVFNGRSTLSAAIRSLQIQTLEAWELIIVDDCSTDGSKDLIREISDQRIRLVRNKRNSGLAASLNRGIDLARAQYIARMDCDDVCFPWRLKVQLEFLRSHADVDLVGGGALEFQDDWKPLLVSKLPTDHDEIIRAIAFGRTPLYHPAWCGRAEWFRSFRYDVTFAKAQDCELLVRGAASSRYANIPVVLIGYRREKFNLVKRIRSRWHVLRAYWKNYACTGRYLDFALSAMATLGRFAFDLLRAPLPNFRMLRREIDGREGNGRASDYLAEWERMRHNFTCL